jgi:hypothetical protein
MSNSSSNKDALSEPFPGMSEKIEKPSSTGEPPKDNEEPESLTRTEAFLLVVSICVSGRQLAPSVN